MSAIDDYRDIQAENTRLRAELPTVRAELCVTLADRKHGMSSALGAVLSEVLEDARIELIFEELLVRREAEARAAAVEEAREFLGSEAMP